MEEKISGMSSLDTIDSRINLYPYICVQIIYVT